MKLAVRRPDTRSDPRSTGGTERCLGILSGGAIGPPGTARNYAGSLAGARTFLGCADHDAHIPLSRVQETTGLFKAMGAAVTERIYPGTFHGVNDDELAQVRVGLGALLESR